MTSPQRDPQGTLRANVGPFIAELNRAASATHTAANRMVDDMRRVEQAIRRAETAARSYRSSVTGLPGGPATGGGGGRARSQRDIDDIYNRAGARRQQEREREQRRQEAEGRRAVREEEARNERRIRSYERVGKAAAVASGVIVAGFLASAAAAIQWESDFAGVEKVTEGTTEQIAVLEGELRELAKTIPSTHTEIAQLAEAAGALGIARENVADFARVSAMLGATTNLSAEDAATGLTKLMTIMGNAPELIDRVGATLVHLGNNGASTEEEILDMSLRLAGAGRVVGMTTSEVMGLASAMASLGIEAELGGGAMSRVILRMSNAVKSGNAYLNAFADIAGQSARDFAKSFSEAPAQAITDVILGLGRIREEGGNVAAAIRSIQLRGSTQEADVLNRLAGGSDEFIKTLKIQAEAWQRNTALINEFSKRAATTASKIQMARNQVVDLAIDLGNALLPAIGNAAEAVSDLGDKLQGLDPMTKEMLSTVGAATGAVGLLAASFLLLLPRIVATRGAAATLGVTMRGVALAFGAVTALITGMAFAAKGIDAWSNSIDKAAGRVVDVEDLREAMVDFAQTGELSGEMLRLWGPNLEGLTEAIETATTKGSTGIRGFIREAAGWTIAAPLKLFGAGFDDLAENVEEGILGIEDKFKTAQAKLKPFDLELGAMVDRGSVAEAQRNADLVIQTYERLNAQDPDEFPMSKLATEIIPNYVKALQKANTAAKEAGKTPNSFGDWGLDVKALEKSLGELIDREFEQGRADDAVASGLEELRDKAKETVVEFEDLRDALDDVVDDNYAAGSAADDYHDSLLDLTDALTGTADEAEDAAKAVDTLASAIDEAIQKAYAGDDAVEAFNKKVSDIRKRIAEGPGNGITVDLDFTDNTGDIDARMRGALADYQRKVAQGAPGGMDPATWLQHVREEYERTVAAIRNNTAQVARDEVQELVSLAGALLEQDIRGGNDQVAAFERRRAELARTLRDLGYLDKDVEATLAKFDSIPGALADAAAEAAKDADKKAKGPRSTALEGFAPDAIANRKDIRALVEDAVSMIQQEFSDGMSDADLGRIVARYRDDLLGELTSRGFDGGQAAGLIDTGLNDLVAKARREAASETEEYSRTLDTSTEAGRDNAEAIRDLVDGVKDQIVAYARSGHTGDEVKAKAQQLTAALEDQLVQMGFNRQEVELYTGVLDSVPEAIDTVMNNDPGPALAAIDGLMAKAAEAQAAMEDPAKLDADPSLAERVLEALGFDYDAMKKDIEENPIKFAAKLLTGPLSPLGYGFEWIKDRLRGIRDDLDKSPFKPWIDWTGGGLFFRGIEWMYKQFRDLRQDLLNNPFQVVFEAAEKVGKGLFSLSVPGLIGKAWSEIRRADGGWVRGPGGPREDLVPARLGSQEYRLSNGEFIAPADSAQANPRVYEAMQAAGGRRVTALQFEGEQEPRRFARGGWPGARGWDGAMAMPYRAPVVAPVVHVTAPGLDLGGLASLIDSRPVVLQVDTQVLARHEGRRGDLYRRT